MRCPTNTWIEIGTSGLGNFAVAQLAAQAANHDGFYDLRQDLADPYSKLEQWQIINTTTWNATGTYTLPLGDNIGKVSVGASFIHTDSMVVNYGDRNSHFPDIAAAGTLPPTDLVNLSLDWNSIVGKPVDLMLFATNVTNKKYFTFISGIGLSTGFETAQLGLPRMYGLRLRVRFGR